MSADWTFEFDPQKTEIKTKLSLKIECEIKFFNREEYDITFAVVNQDTDAEIPFLSLDLWDRALISDRAWNPPLRKVIEAQQEYEESRQPQYDKYVGL